MSIKVTGIKGIVTFSPNNWRDRKQQQKNNISVKIATQKEAGDLLAKSDAIWQEFTLEEFISSPVTCKKQAGYSLTMNFCVCVLSEIIAWS